MNDDNFLSRWSRRKRAVIESERAERAQIDAAEQTEPTSDAVGPASDSAEPPFDLSTLPSLESITAETDITAFLRSGVPGALRHAALRRAWVADPAIRDFKGLAENAWDFNDPTAMAGFGPLEHSPDQLQQLASKVFGDAERVMENFAEAVESAPPAPPAAKSAASVPRGERGEHAATARLADTAEHEKSSSPEDVAMQQEKRLSSRRRDHGGALPT